MCLVVSVSRLGGAEEGLLQLLQFVARLGGRLELQVAGVAVHVGLQLLDPLGCLVGRERGVIGCRFRCLVRPAPLSTRARAGDTRLACLEDVLDALLDAARGDFEAAEAAVAQARSETEYTRIEAPFDGVVTERLVEPGQLANPG